jgi:hypothetical protein
MIFGNEPNQPLEPIGPDMESFWVISYKNHFSV